MERRIWAEYKMISALHVVQRMYELQRAVWWASERASQRVAQKGKEIKKRRWNSVPPFFSSFSKFSMAAFSLLLCILAISSLRFVSSSSSSSICPPRPLFFVTALQSQCPLSIAPSPPLQVDGESLDKALSSVQANEYTAVFFYASWCPFSRSAYSTFDMLSYMFPQITHLQVEETSAMPIIFSRHGIHSFPAILLANRTSRVRYNGPKDLNSLTIFYKTVTGFEPIQFVIDNQPSSLGSPESYPWDGSPNEILSGEPYLVFSLLFFCLKILLYFFPGMLSRVKAFWISYGWHLNLGIFGETSQLLERVLHVANVQRAWSKFRLCKTRNFQNGAKNARVWASLASVSLGDSSSSRTADS